MASITHSGFDEKYLPKLPFIIFAPLSTAYLIAKATSLSYSSPFGTALSTIILARLFIPLFPFLFCLSAAIIPDT